MISVIITYIMISLCLAACVFVLGKTLEIIFETLALLVDYVELKKKEVKDDC